MPATTTEPKFNCGTCGKEYRWKPELAGKKAKCKCGNVIAVPAKAPSAPRPAPKPADDAMDFDGLYALAQEEKKATRAAPVDEAAAGYRCPSCSATLPPGAAVCPSCRTDMRTGLRAAGVAVAGGGVLAAAGAYANATPTARAGVLPYGGGAAAGGRSRVDEDILYEGGKFCSLYLPLGLIVLGILFYFGQVAFSNDKLSAGVMVAMVGARILLDSILIFIAMLIAVRAFDMGFGAFGPAVLKVLAIALGPGALGQMVESMLGGEIMAIMVGILVAVVLYFTLIKVLFNLDLGETFLLVILIIGVRRVLGTFLFVALIGLASSGALSEDGAAAVGGGALAVVTAGEDGEDPVPAKRMLSAEEIAEDLNDSALSTLRYTRGGTEATSYLESHKLHKFTNMDKAKSAEVVKALTDLGAKSVTCTGFNDVEAPDGGRVSAVSSILVELPEDPGQRKKIFEYRADLLKSLGQKEVMIQVEVGGREDEPKKEEPLKDWGQKYVSIHFGYGKEKSYVDPRFKRFLEQAAEEAEEGEDEGDGEDMEDGDAPAAAPAPAPAPAEGAAPPAAEAPAKTEADAAQPAPAEPAPF